MKEPNFFIIGTQKAGTTSLYFHLRGHDQIFMSPIKEPKYFSLVEKSYQFNGPGDQQRIKANSVDEWSDYMELFNEAKDEIAVGEASTWYLYDPLVASRIHRVYPQAKIITILRNPVDRAFSAFLHQVREGRETCVDFECGLKKEAQRIADNFTPFWHYKSVGYYYHQLERYYALFPENQILIIRYEEYKNDPLNTLNIISDFLEIDPFVKFDQHSRHNISGIPKSRSLDNLITKNNLIKEILKPLIPRKYRRSLMWKIRNLMLEKPSMREETRMELNQIYMEDIRKLEQLIDSDLDHWLLG